MSKRLYILLLLMPCLVSCAVSNEFHLEQATFARNNSALIKEMAGYAILFSAKNNIHSFKTDDIADRKTRKKMERLGSMIEVTYSYPGSTIMDSTVTFKSITVSHGVIEFMYDFAVNPQNAGTDTSSNKQSVTIQVNERVYYNRMPFPMM